MKKAKKVFGVLGICGALLVGVPAVSFAASAQACSGYECGEAGDGFRGEYGPMKVEKPEPLRAPNTCKGDNCPTRI